MTDPAFTAAEWAEKYQALAATYREALAAVAARQERERTAWRDEWGTRQADEPADLPPLAWPSHEAARAAADEDTSITMCHRRVTDWQTVRPANLDNT